MSSSGLSQFQLSYELSPILLTGGIAENLSGGMMPVINLLQPQDFSGGVTAPADGDFDAVAHFLPPAGSTLIENVAGLYPLASQQAAANTVISQPLRVSLVMIAPAPTQGGYTAKTAALTSLQQTIAKHNAAGGLYTVATPSYTYVDCILLSIRDISAADGVQVQTRWQWDFLQPLITAEAVQGAQNTLTSKMSSGVQITGDPPGSSPLDTSTGSAGSGAGPALVPSARGTNAASTGTGNNPLGFGITPGTAV